MDESYIFLWIIVMFLSAVWTLILTAPIHCRGSSDVTQIFCFSNLKQTHPFSLLFSFFKTPFNGVIKLLTDSLSAFFFWLTMLLILNCFSYNVFLVICLTSSLSLSPTCIGLLDSVFGVNLKLSAVRDEHGFALSIYIFTSCHSLKWLSHDLLSFCCLAFITYKFHTTRHISAFVISFHCSNICVLDLQKCNTLLQWLSTTAEGPPNKYAFTVFVCNMLICIC